MVQTGISLNERFTQMQQTQPAAARRGRSRSRSRGRRIVETMVDPSVSTANARLLREFKRKHTVQTAMKLKRRSLRTTASGRGGGSGGGVGASGAGVGRRVGGVKTLRLAPNGRPVRTNNATRVATMRADLVANRTLRSSGGGGGGGGRPRRSNSAVNMRQRLGLRRPTVGGAAERVAMRRGQRGSSVQRRKPGRNGLVQQQQQQQQQRGRSRSRSRGRMVPVDNALPRGNNGRRRSQSRGRSMSRGPSVSRGSSVPRGRSQSRGRAPVRDLSRTRGRPQSRGRQPRISVKDRLGVRPGTAADAGNKKRRQRRSNSKLRGVATGRIGKRPNVAAQKEGVAANASGARRGRGRPRGRSAVRAAVAAGATRRSRSRQRQNVAAAANQQGSAGNKGNTNNNGRRNRRGRSANRNGNATADKPKANQQRRRGRSRGRQGAAGTSGVGRRLSGQQRKTEVKREDLDKEIDQYMSTTKSEMDFLLK